MENHRLVKIVTFGWIKGSKRSIGNENRVDFVRGVHRALKDRDIPEIDWYRQAQDRNKWRQRAVYGIRPDQVEELKKANQERAKKWTGGGRKDAFKARQMLGNQRQNEPGKPDMIQRPDGKYEYPVYKAVSETKEAYPVTTAKCTE